MVGAQAATRSARARGRTAANLRLGSSGTVLAGRAGQVVRAVVGGFL